MLLDRQTLKDILVKCDICKDCIDPCPVNALDPSLNRNPLLRIKIAELLYRDQSVPPELVEGLWYCTTCGICNEKCAPNIDVRALGRALREWARERSEHAYPAKYDEFWQKMRTTGNPYAGDLKTALRSFRDHVVPPEEADFHLHLGCTLPLKFPDLVPALLDVLRHLKFRFALVGDPLCCGGVLLRTGDSRHFDENARQWHALCERDGITRLVTACSGCYSTFTEIFKDPTSPVRVEHVLELVEPELRPLMLPADSPVELHQSCHLTTHRPRLYREIAAKISNLAASSPRRCCGAGGGFLGAFPEGARTIAQNLIAEKRAAGATTLVTDCPFCYTNLSTCAGDLPVVYFFEFLKDRLAL